MSEQSAKHPTHRVYAVAKGKEDKAHWNQIGAAWPHKDGKGFSLKLDVYPCHGTELVIRTANDKPRKGARKGGAQ